MEDAAICITPLTFKSFVQYTRSHFDCAFTSASFVSSCTAWSILSLSGSFSHISVVCELCCGHSRHAVSQETLTWLQTGSGKTHTVIGDISDPDMSGIVPRAVGMIFDEHSTDAKFSRSVSVAAVEIYCERIRACWISLLAPTT